MDERCLQHLLTDEERASFESDGYLIIKNALPQDLVPKVEAALKKVEAKREHDKDTSLGGGNWLDVIGEDDLLLELIDWAATLPKVWGFLGGTLRFTTLTISFLRLYLTTLRSGVLAGIRTAAESTLILKVIPGRASPSKLVFFLRMPRRPIEVIFMLSLVVI